MKVAYVDASSLIAIEFNEVAGSAVARLLEEHERLIALNLHQAELRTAFHCEYTKFDANPHSGIESVLPKRPQTFELATTQTAGYLRAVDLAYLATASYSIGTAVPNEVAEFSIVTLD